MVGLDLEGLEKIKNKLKNCSKEWFVHTSTCGAKVAIPSRCNSRYCVICSKRKSLIALKKYENWIDGFKKPKHLVLTVPNVAGPILKETLEKITRAFRKLRQQNFMKDKIKRGVFVHELSVNKENFSYHPHIHALIDSDYIDQEALSKKWEKLTGGSVVWISKVDDIQEAKKELFKYFTKAWEIPDEMMDDVILAYHGKRVLNWIGKPVKNEKKSLNKEKKCHVCGTDCGWKTEIMTIGMLEIYRENIWLNQIYYEGFYQDGDRLAVLPEGWTKERNEMDEVIYS